MNNADTTITFKAGRYGTGKVHLVEKFRGHYMPVCSCPNAANGSIQQKGVEIHDDLNLVNCTRGRKIVERITRAQA